MRSITLILSVLYLSTCLSQTTATYTVTFNSEWNASDHGTLPNDAHWSKLVGATHNSDVSFWSLGQTASQGIEDISEIGNNTAFLNEVTASINAGDSNQYIDGNNLPAATGSIIIEDIEVNQDFPLLTLASMIAPSSDWFIGINDISLIDTENNWIPTIIMDLFVYDAGTEDGNSYSYDNEATNPQGVISSKNGVFPFNNERVGTLTIMRTDNLSIPEETLSANIKLFPNPSNGMVNIITEKGTVIKNIFIYDVLGNNMYQHNNLTKQTNITLNLKTLKTGMYLLKTTSYNGEITNKKLVVE